MTPKPGEPEVHPENPLRGLNTVGGALCLDFTNTVGHRKPEVSNERLRTEEDLLCWANRVGLLGAIEFHEMVVGGATPAGGPRRRLRRAIELREVLYRIFSRVSGGAEANGADLTWLSEEVRRARSRQALVEENGRFRWAWTARDIWARVLGEVALSGAELLTGPDLLQVGACAGPDCDWLFVDTSRNRARRWCDMRECGNRAKARRYHHRHRPP